VLLNASDLTTLSVLLPSLLLLRLPAEAGCDQHLVTPLKENFSSTLLPGDALAVTLVSVDENCGSRQAGTYGASWLKVEKGLGT
jgi:hypothetical protein